MTYLEPSEKLIDCANKAMACFKEPMDSPTYVTALVKLCETVAACVFEKKESVFGSQLDKDVFELADKAPDVVSYCAVLLQHAIKHGYEEGFDFAFLEQKLNLPLAIMLQTMYQLQDVGESWANFINRNATDYQATKAIMRELVHYADITKYDNPTKTEHVLCSRHLEKAMVLKNRLKEDRIIEPLVILHNLGKVTPFTVEKLQWSSKDVSLLYKIAYSGGIIPVGSLGFSAPIQKANGKVACNISLSFNPDIHIATINTKVLEQLVEFANLHEYRRYKETFVKYINEKIAVERFNQKG